MVAEMRIINLLLLSLFYILLVGCQSEIDKCVNAAAKDYPNLKETQARISCLQAANGNKN